MLKTFDGVDVFVHSPMYGAMCTLPYHISMLQTAVTFLKRGISWRTYPLGGESLVSRARNVLTSEFLKSPATHMMCIDSDIGWMPEDLVRLITADKDIACGVYPKKCYPAAWPMNHFRSEGGILVTDPETGYIDIKDAPTGFLLVKRHVIERLVELHPETKCNFKEGGEENNRYCYDLFEAFIDRESGMYLSEDFGFCRRAQAAGFRVWCDPRIRLTHTGTHVFDHGCVADLMTLGEVDINTDIEGWMTVPELTWLHSTAKDMGSVVEIGSWKGRSTYALATGCKGPVYAVDTWQGSPEERSGPHKEATERDIFVEFYENMKPVIAKVHPVREESVAAAGMFGDCGEDEYGEAVEPGVSFWQPDMVFIDADHAYEAVKADIAAWTPKAKRLICGHDYNEPPVARAVHEAFGERVTLPSGNIWAVWL